VKNIEDFNQLISESTVLIKTQADDLDSKDYCFLDVMPRNLVEFYQCIRGSSSSAAAAAKHAFLTHSLL
jgi:hypothetical protein